MTSPYVFHTISIYFYKQKHHFKTNIHSNRSATDKQTIKLNTTKRSFSGIASTRQRIAHRHFPHNRGEAQTPYSTMAIHPDAARHSGKRQLQTLVSHFLSGRQRKMADRGQNGRRGSPRSSQRDEFFPWPF